MTGETPEVRSDKRKPREKKERETRENEREERKRERKARKREKTREKVREKREKKSGKQEKWRANKRIAFLEKIVYWGENMIAMKILQYTNTIEKCI